MIIDTQRPNSTVTGGGWAVVGGASAQAVLSDDSDATYVEAGPTDTPITLGYPDHTPAAGHERHRIQMRARVSASPANSMNLTVRTMFKNPVGTTVPPGNVVLRTFSDWYMQANLATAGAVNMVGTGAAQGQQFDTNFTVVTNARIYEAYVLVDTRAQPSFTPEVQDGAGVDQNGSVITDTPRPTFVFGPIDYDGLNARSWTLEVRTDPGGVVVFSDSGVGLPPATIATGPLANGDYEADLQVFSTIRTNDAYASDVENLTFEIAFVAPASPVVTATLVPTPPSVDLDWVSDSATATTWDVNADVVTEIRRTDCNGTRTFYMERTGIGAAEFTDRFMSLSYDGVFCGDSDHVCEVCYEARYWGEVDSILVASDWSTPECLDEVPNPTPGNSWIRGGASGDQSVCPDESYVSVRPFGVFQPIGGGIPTVTSGSPGGRDYSLAIAVESEAELVSLEAILAQTIIFYQPVGQADIWLAPNVLTAQITKVKRIRTVSIDTVAVNPQPVATPASFFA